MIRAVYLLCCWKTSVAEPSGVAAGSPALPMAVIVPRRQQRVHLLAGCDLPVLDAPRHVSRSAYCGQTLQDCACNVLQSQRS